MVPKQIDQLRLIYLPKPRRAQHPYQWACMGGLLFYAAANLILGPASHSPLLLVQGSKDIYLNIELLLGAVCCLTAAIIPDNWFRLWIELCGHLLLITTAGTFLVIALQGFADTRHDGNPGLSLNVVMFLCITVAAIGRTYEITKTIRRTLFTPNSSGAIVEIDGSATDTGN